MKFLKEDYDKTTIKLKYEDLPITLSYNYKVDYWDGPDWDTANFNIDYNYIVDRDEIEDFLLDFIPEDLIEEKDIENYFKSNFDKLFKEHKQEILDYFKADAIEEAEDKLDYYDLIEDPDYEE